MWNLFWNNKLIKRYFNCGLHVDKFIEIPYYEDIFLLCSLLLLQIFLFFCKEDSNIAPISFKKDAIDKPYLKFIEFNVKEKGNKTY